MVTTAEKLAALRAYATFNVGRNSSVSRREVGMTIYAILGDEDDIYEHAEGIRALVKTMGVTQLRAAKRIERVKKRDT